MKKILLLSIFLSAVSCTKKTSESPNDAGKRIVSYLNSSDHGNIYESFSETQKIHISTLLKDLKENIKKDNDTDLAILDSLKISRQDILNMNEKEFYIILKNSLRESFLLDIKSFKDSLNKKDVEPSIKYTFTSVVENKSLNGYNVNYDYTIDYGDNKTQTIHQKFFIINENGQWKISETTH